MQHAALSFFYHFIYSFIFNSFRDVTLNKKLLENDSTAKVLSPTTLNEVIRISMGAFLRIFFSKSN